jgi:hypothetical protein
MPLMAQIQHKTDRYMKLQQLETFFKTANIPDKIIIDSGTVITDVKKCIDSHVLILKENAGNRAYIPYYDRLMIIYKAIKLNGNI